MRVISIGAATQQHTASGAVTEHKKHVMPCHTHCSLSGMPHLLPEVHHMGSPFSVSGSSEAGGCHHISLLCLHSVPSPNKGSTKTIRVMFTRLNGVRACVCVCLCVCVRARVPRAIHVSSAPAHWAASTSKPTAVSNNNNLSMHKEHSAVHLRPLQLPRMPDKTHDTAHTTQTTVGPENTQADAWSRPAQWVVSNNIEQ